jgi:hypothetical protein
MIQYQNPSLNKSLVMKHDSQYPECGNCANPFPISKEDAFYLFAANWPIVCYECKHRLSDIVINPHEPEETPCLNCGTMFTKKYESNQFCSRECGGRMSRKQEP